MLTLDEDFLGREFTALRLSHRIELVKPEECEELEAYST